MKQETTKEGAQRAYEMGPCQHRNSGEDTRGVLAQRAWLAHAGGAKIEACEGWLFVLGRQQRDIHVFSDGSSLHRGKESGAWIVASKEITKLTLAKMGVTVTDRGLII